MRIRTRVHSALSAVALTGAMAAAGLTSASPAAAASAPNAWPAHVFAPFVDTWSGNVTLSDAANNYGTKFFTIAFVDGPGCHWSIGG